MPVRTSAYRIVAPLAALVALLQLTACAVPYSLPLSVRTPVGQSAHLVCPAGEIQWCREAGTAMRCTCSTH